MTDRLPWLARLLLLFVLLLPSIAAEAQASLSVETKGAALRGRALHLDVILESERPETVTVVVDGRTVQDLDLEPGSNEVTLPAPSAAASYQLELRSDDLATTTRIRTIPGWLSIAPPLLAILLALIFRDVLISLFLGVFLGAWILQNWNPFRAFASSIESFIVPALANPDHASILVFSTLLGGMVGLISKSGGTRGIVERIRKWATSPERGQVATWLMGIVIFFDDYANTLIVGSTMRPLTDRLRISREKLAYIVDSTAAPVVTIVPISTWIGFEIGLLAAAFSSVGITTDAYAAFLASIPYRFYPILALMLVLVIAASGRDFGPMLRAERRARSTGEVLGEGAVPLANLAGSELAPPDGVPYRAVNAVVPILTVIVITFAGLFITGSGGIERAEFASTGEWLRAVFSDADSYAALLWASLAGVTIALLLPITQRLMPLRELMSGLVGGFKAMLLALVVLVLAWSIGGVTEQLHTADYVVGLTEGILSPHWIGVIVFVTAALIAFATGTSWGTMAILMPLVVPVAHGIAISAGHAPGSTIYNAALMGGISSVLAGSVWGDHCSPISDTTILSSMATGCDHIEHVRTQLPYAIGIGVLGLLIGEIPAGYGMSPWISILAGAVVIVAGVLWLGRRADAVEAPQPQS
jgi:Na+/H+ antiporter NhaC